MSRRVVALLLTIFLVFALPVTGAGESADSEKETDQWYQHWMYDTNHNRLDERIEEKMAAEPETPIPVFVDYDHRPGAADLERMEAAGFQPGYVTRLIDTICVDAVHPSDMTRHVLPPSSECVSQL